VAETYRRRWRDYSSPSGRRPVGDFFADLSDTDAAAIVAAMKEVAIEGLSAARHLRGEGKVLLALDALKKRSGPQ
jgi:hypothetical protein